MKGSVHKRSQLPQQPSVVRVSPHSLGGRRGREVGGGKKHWKEALLTGPTARTKGRKKLKWALRTTDKLEVGGPQPSWDSLAAPPAPLNTGPRYLSPTSQPQGEQRAEVAGASDLAAGDGLNGHVPPHRGSPGHKRSCGPRGPGGAPGDMRGPGRLRQPLQKHTVIFLLTLSLSPPPLLKTPQGHLVLLRQRQRLCWANCRLPSSPCAHLCLLPWPFGSVCNYTFLCEILQSHRDASAFAHCGTSNRRQGAWSP